MVDKIQNIQKHIGKLSKDTKGYNYKYFDINQLLEKVQPLLEKEGLVVTQPIKDGKVVTTITDIKTGDTLTSELELPKDVKPQDIGSAITYYRRYTLVSLLALEAEDDDGKKASEPKGLTEEVFTRLYNAYKEKGTMTPDMQAYYEKCTPAQKAKLKEITKNNRS